VIAVADDLTFAPERVSRIDLRSCAVRHRRTAARLSPGAFTSATPRACHLEGQPQLPPSCRLDSAHVALSAWTAAGCVVTAGRAPGRRTSAGTPTSGRLDSAEVRPPAADADADTWARLRRRTARS
jgi:hypothetical protein